MTTKLKVWGGSKGGRERALVAASRQKEAVKLLNAAGFNTSLYDFRGYWAQTYNLTELSVATVPGIWVCVMMNGLGSDDPEDYRKQEPRR